MKLKQALTLLFIFVLFTPAFAGNQDNTFLLLPSLSEISKLYGVEFQDKKNQFFPNYKNQLMGDGSVESARYYKSVDSDSFIYIQIGYYTNVGNIWENNKQNTLEIAKKNKQKTYPLNIGEDSIYREGGLASYSFKYKNYIARIISTNNFDGKLVLNYLFKNIEKNEKGLLNKKELTLTKLYILTCFDKNYFSKDSKQYNTDIKIQLFDKTSEIYNKNLNIPLKILDTELNHVNTQLSIPLDKKLTSLLQNISPKSLLVISIKGHKPLFKVINKDSFDINFEDIQLKDNLKCASIFKEPEYCPKNGNVPDNILYNITNNEYYYLSGEIRYNDNIILVSYNKQNQLASVKLIQKKSPSDSYKIFLDDKGNLVFMKMTNVNPENALYKIENNQLVSIPVLDFIKNNKNYSIFDIYIFNNEIIKDGIWQVPYYRDYKPIHVNNRIFRYNRVFSANIKQKIACINKQKFFKLKKAGKINTASNFLYYSDYKRERSKSLKYQEKYEIKILDFLGRTEKKLTTKKFSKYLDEILENIPENCKAYETIIDFNFNDYLNDVPIASKEDVVKAFAEQWVGNFSNLPSYKASIDDVDGALLFGTGFGIPLYPTGRNEALLNKAIGPYSELRFCDKGKIIKKEVINTGWTQFKKTKEKDFNISITKEGYKSINRILTVPIDNKNILNFSGTISDEQGNPLKGATVLIEDKSTKTDEKGLYKLTFNLNNNGVEDNIELDFSLKEAIGKLQVELINQENIYPDGKSYQIKIKASDRGEPFKNKKIEIAKIDKFYLKSGKLFKPKGLEDGFYINKTYSTDDKGILSASINIPKLKDKFLRDEADIVFPLHANLIVCEKRESICKDVKITIDNPAPKIKARIPSGLEAGVWQTKPSVVSIKDPNDTKLKITIAAKGRLKEAGNSTFYSNRLIKTIETGEFKFFYEPSTIEGLDLTQELPNELQAYLDTNIKVLSGFIGVFGDFAASGGLGTIAAKKVLPLENKVFFKNYKNLEKLYKAGSKGLGLPDIQLSTEGTASSLKEANYDTAVNIMDWSIGTVDFIGGTLNETKVGELISGKNFTVNKLEALSKPLTDKLKNSSAQLIKKFKLDKISKFISGNDTLKGGLSLEVLKAVYANAKTTYDIFNQYKSIAYAYQDIDFLPIIIKVEDELGYYDLQIIEIGVKLWKKN